MFASAWHDHRSSLSDVKVCGAAAAPDDMPKDCVTLPARSGSTQVTLKDGQLFRQHGRGWNAFNWYPMQVQAITFTCSYNHIMPGFVHAASKNFLNGRMNWPSMEWGFCCRPGRGTYLDFYESGRHVKRWHGKWRTNSVMQVRLNKQGRVEYVKSGTVLHTSGKKPSGPVMFAVAWHDHRSRMTQVKVCGRVPLKAGPYDAYNGKTCTGRSYTKDGMKCNGWSGLTEKKCWEKCSLAEQAPNCPLKPCYAAAFTKSGGKCHLYDSCEDVAETGLKLLKHKGAPKSCFTVKKTRGSLSVSVNSQGNMHRRSGRGWNAFTWYPTKAQAVIFKCSSHHIMPGFVDTNRLSSLSPGFAWNQLNYGFCCRPGYWFDLFQSGRHVYRQRMRMQGAVFEVRLNSAGKVEAVANGQVQYTWGRKPPGGDVSFATAWHCHNSKLYGVKLCGSERMKLTCADYKCPRGKALKPNAEKLAEGQKLTKEKCCQDLPKCKKCKWFFPGWRQVTCQSTAWDQNYNCDKALTRAKNRHWAWHSRNGMGVRGNSKVEMQLTFHQPHKLYGWREQCAAPWGAMCCLNKFKIQKGDSVKGPWTSVYANSAGPSNRGSYKGAEFYFLEPVQSKYLNMVFESNHGDPHYGGRVVIRQMEFYGLPVAGTSRACRGQKMPEGETGCGHMLEQKCKGSFWEIDTRRFQCAWVEDAMEAGGGSCVTKNWCEGDGTNPFIVFEFSGNHEFNGRQCRARTMGERSNLPLKGSSFTLEAWVKPRHNRLTNAGIVGWGHYGRRHEVNALRIEIHGGKKQLRNYWWGDDMLRTSNSIWDGKYHHVATTWDEASKTHRMYVDGSQVGSPDDAKTNKNRPRRYNVRTKNNFCVGATNRQFWNGWIQDLKIYNTAVSAQDIKKIYETTKAKVQNF